MHVDTLGAEKKGGVPYILTSPRRHRQTPASKHDQKTRHVGLAHVAQPSYLAYSFYFGEVFSVAIIRCCVRAGGLSGLPSSSALARRSRGDRPIGNPRFCPNSLGGADGDGTPSLPFGRAGARPSLGFGPMAGTRCRSSPRNRVTKSRTRRCQRSNLPSPFILPLTGNVRKYIPFPRRFQAGNAVFGNCTRGAGVDWRPETGDPRHEETVRQ